MDLSQTKIPSQKFHAWQTEVYREKRARKAQRKTLFITTKLRRKANTGMANSLQDLATTQVPTRMFRMNKALTRIKGKVIIMRRQTPRESSLRGTPMAVIIIIRPRIQRAVKKSPHDLNMKRLPIQTAPSNLIMQRLPEISLARDAKSRQL